MLMTDRTLEVPISHRLKREITRWIRGIGSYRVFILALQELFSYQYERSERKTLSLVAWMGGMQSAAPHARNGPLP